jgi:hypothetical protein
MHTTQLQYMLAFLHSCVLPLPVCAPVHTNYRTCTTAASTSTNVDVIIYCVADPRRPPTPTPTSTMPVLLQSFRRRNQTIDTNRTNTKTRKQQTTGKRTEATHVVPCDQCPCPWAKVINLIRQHTCFTVHHHATSWPPRFCFFVPYHVTRSIFALAGVYPRISARRATKTNGHAHHKGQTHHQHDNASSGFD